MNMYSLTGTHCNKNYGGSGIWKAVFYLIFFVFFPLLSIHADLVRSGAIQSDERWRFEDSPVMIQGDLVIAEGADVAIEAGVDVRIEANAVITVLGRLDAEGAADDPIRFHPMGSRRWGAVSYEREGAGQLKHCYFERGSYASDHRNGVVNAYRCTAPVIIDSCTFTDWPGEFDSKAANGYYSTQMVVRNCWFGEGASEVVYGVHSPMLIEHNTFMPRFDYRDAVDIGDTQNPGPIIRYNVFWGSEDDAIDLDDCDAYVEGNLVMNCRGGSHDPIGISGDRTSKPILVNNIIVNCESGIGFKNGAEITVINNTVIDCDRGVWLHQNPAHAKLINTIIWGREDQVSIRLEEGSTIDVSYSLIRGDSIYPGEGNLNEDPLFVDPLNRLFQLLAGSPAIDAGWSGEGVLDYDYDGAARVGNVDIGALEYAPGETAIGKWIEFE
ncbi:MAG: right-handed parallel beta-helix repeat-containing protein [Candidatus Omnitrophica bacterium]|nr:right-handed parallel beta-helix repeat-containing protein [Candidatus Omnitrophota bacterium]